MVYGLEPRKDLHNARLSHYTICSQCLNKETSLSLRSANYLTHLNYCSEICGTHQAKDRNYSY